MHCHQVQQLLVDYIDGELSPDLTRDLETHLKDCIPCHDFINTYRATIKITRKVEPAEMPQELKDKLKSFIREKIDKDKRC